MPLPVRLIVGTLISFLAFPAFADDSREERWNAYGQFTYIWQRKEPFSAAYKNVKGSPNSLVPEKERSFTATATAFLGLRGWKGGDVYFVPEIISGLPLSELRGLGGSIQNGELEKNATVNPTLYVSRFFLRQSWELGGKPDPVGPGPMQLAGSADSHRLVFTVGNLSVIDIFDKNSYAGDVRQQFISMDFLTHAAFDFEADARGYTWGLAAEYYYDSWVLRLGRFVGPRNPNQLQLDFRIMKYYGDNLEIEHKHELRGQPGKISLLYFRNVGNMGRWDDAINALNSDPGKNATTCTGFNYGSANAAAPDLCWVRKRNTKTGLGVNLEQSLTKDIGVFFRGMKADGQTEVYAYTASDSSVSLGSIIKGTRWGRGRDSVGVGYAQNWLSAAHISYLNMGGIDGFIGDGRISYKPEKAFEVYYNVNLNRSWWVSFDFQRVFDPAYNSDRGPVTVYGARMHAEF